MIDPRPALIERRLATVGRIVAVTGGKGGIGKSLVASTLALGLADEGAATGLLDLDFTGPCDDIFLGVESAFPEERGGILPQDVAGVGFVSITSFSGRHAAPLRGRDTTDAILELLAIVQWGELDWLVLDMPPGIGDPLLDALRLMRRIEYLVVATGSTVVVRTVERTLELLSRVRAPVLGLVDNMARDGRDDVAALAGGRGLPLLGRIPFDDGLESALGDPERLRRTDAARAVREVGRRLRDGATAPA